MSHFYYLHCKMVCLCALLVRLVKNALPASQSALAASLTLAHYFAKLKSLLLIFFLLLLTIFTAFFVVCIVVTPCLGACFSCYFFD